MRSGVTSDTATSVRVHSVSTSCSIQTRTLKMTTHGTDVIPYIKVYHSQFLEEISCIRKYFEREG